MAAKAHRSKFHVRMWNFSTSDSINETDVNNDGSGNCKGSSSSDKSSDLFDSALMESNSAPASLNRTSTSYKRHFYQPRNLTAHDSQTKDRIQTCIDESMSSVSSAGSNGMTVPKSYAGENIKSIAIVHRKWGATSKTRQQLKAEEIERKDVYIPVPKTLEQSKPDKIVVARKFPKGLGTEKTKELSLEAVRCKKRKMEENDRFALFSDDDDEEVYNNQSEVFGNSEDERLTQENQSEVVEFNFLGEPVNSSSCNDFSDTDHAYSILHQQKKPKIGIIKKKPENLQTSKHSECAKLSFTTRLKKTATNDTFSTFLPTTSAEAANKIAFNKYDFSIPTAEENIVIDSDYFSQSQTPDSPDVAKNPESLLESKVIESESGVKTTINREDITAPCTLSINSSSSMLKKCMSQPLPLSPVREKKKLNSNRRSPQKARYNARSWMCNSNDENSSKGSLRENESDGGAGGGVGLGNAALREDIFSAPVHSSARNDSNLLPEPSTLSNGGLTLRNIGDTNLNTTVCQVKPITEKFAGLKRVSTAPAGSTRTAEMGESRNNLLPKLPEASEYDFEDVLSNRFEPSLLMNSPDLKETVKVSRKEKELYLVIRSVKTMHESLEDGESQKFKEDIQYLLEGVHPSCPLTTRCLSVASIATKSLQIQFRMQMRAHGVLGRLSLLLNDSLRHQSLSLCTAALFYIMSRDRVALDMDAYSLVLIVKLLKFSGSVGRDKPLNVEAKNEVEENRELVKAKSKIAKMLTSLDDSASKLLMMANAKTELTVHSLILEAVVSVTNAGNWSNPFKSQLVQNGILSHIIESYKNCVDNVCEANAEDEEFLKLTLKKMIRCSKVIENVTFRHKENQHTLIVEDSGSLIAFGARVFCKLVTEIKQNVNMNAISSGSAGSRNNANCRRKFSNNGGGVTSASTGEKEDSSTSACNDMLHDSIAESLQEGLMECLRVGLNLTNESELGSTKLGNQSGMLSSLIDCVLHIPVLLDPEKYFDVSIMSLGLMINLLEYSPLNRRQFMAAHTPQPYQAHQAVKTAKSLPSSSRRTMSAVQAFVDLFVTKEKMARQIEEEEKLNETCSEDNSSVMTAQSNELQSVAVVASRVDGDNEVVSSEQSATRRIASRRAKELVRSGSIEEKEDLIVEHETGKKDRKIDGSKGARNKMTKLDEEFVDDGEGGMIWIGRNSEESSEESMNEKERRKKEVHNIIEQSLQAAGKHMESSMIAAYVALLIGCLLQGNMNNILSVLKFVPTGNFQNMIEQLERLHKFMALTTAANTGLLNSISTQIAVLKDANQRAATLDEHF